MATHDSQSIGRPPKAPEQRLSEIVRVRMTPSEADSLYRFAIRHGRPLHDVIRAALRRLITTVDRDPST